MFVVVLLIMSTFQIEKNFIERKKHVIFINIFESFVICKQFVRQNIEIKLNLTKTKLKKRLTTF